MFSSNLNCNFIGEFNPDLRSHTFTSHLRDILVSKLFLQHTLKMLVSCFFYNGGVVCLGKGCKRTVFIITCDWWRIWKWTVISLKCTIFLLYTHILGLESICWVYSKETSHSYFSWGFKYPMFTNLSLKKIQE